MLEPCHSKIVTVEPIIGAAIEALDAGLIDVAKSLISTNFHEKYLSTRDRITIEFVKSEVILGENLEGVFGKGALLDKDHAIILALLEGNWISKAELKSASRYRKHLKRTGRDHNKVVLWNDATASQA